MSRPIDISLYQIQVFVKAAEFKSFTAVATHFNTTQSSISKSVAATEAVLGFPLFIRTLNKLELSAQGKYLYEHWRGLIANVEATLDKASLMYQHRMQTLTIGIPDSLESGSETTYLKEFRERYPEVQIACHVIPASQLISRLETDELDLIITGRYEHKVLEQMGFGWKNYVNVPNLVIMHRDNPLAQRETLTMEDLKDEEFVMLAPSDNASYFERIYLLCAKHGFQPKISGFMPTFRSMITTLIQNQKGVVISNPFISGADHPDLRAFELQGTNAGMVVAWKKKTTNKYVQKLVELFPSCEKEGLL